MWADPDISPVFQQGQAAQTRAVAENLRIPKRIRPEKSLQPHINPAISSSVNGSSSTVSTTTPVVMSPLDILPATGHTKPTPNPPSWSLAKRLLWSSFLFLLFLIMPPSSASALHLLGLIFAVHYYCCGDLSALLSVVACIHSSTWGSDGIVWHLEFQLVPTLEPTTAKLPCRIKTLPRMLWMLSPHFMVYLARKSS